MALATTCPQCRTRFRVTPAQLQQRAGRVRCGICRHAFDALEELDELDVPPDGEPIQADVPSGAATAAPEDVTFPVTADAVGTDGVDARNAAPVGDEPTADLPGDLPDAFRKLLDEWPSELDWSAPRCPAPAAASSSHPSSPVEQDAGALRTGAGTEAGTTFVEAEHEASPEPGPAPMLRHPSADAVTSARNTESVLPPAADLPRFGVPVPADGGDASPWHARLLAVGTTVLVVAALLQAALLGRHWLAAREPALRPALQALAGSAGLRVELPRRLSSLTLEGFDLQATGPEGRLALTAVLRNRGGTPVQWPALELTLTDEGGGVVVRRALLPVEYLRGSGAKLEDGMAARSELPVRMLLDAPLTRSAGYAVDLFYP